MAPTRASAKKRKMGQIAGLKSPPGRAMTMAVGLLAFRGLRVSTEGLRVDRTPTARIVADLPTRVVESQFQLSARLRL
jgi:hypothetical protein